MNSATPGLKRSLSLSLLTLYGLARQGWIPAIFGKVHLCTRTPIATTLAVVGSILAMALAQPVKTVKTLARMTSLLLLIVFALINLALLRIKQNGDETFDGLTIPRWVPLAGFVSSLGFLGYQLFSGVLA